jgi:hypothetical protein
VPSQTSGASSSTLKQFFYFSCDKKHRFLINVGGEKFFSGCIVDDDCAKSQKVYTM